MISSFFFSIIIQESRIKGSARMASLYCFLLKFSPVNELQWENLVRSITTDTTIPFKI